MILVSIFALKYTYALLSLQMYEMYYLKGYFHNIDDIIIHDYNYDRYYLQLYVLFILLLKLKKSTDAKLQY